MAQPYAKNYTSSEQTNSNKISDLRDKASTLAEDTSKEARNLVDSLVDYAKAKPIEAVAIAAGVAFIAGGILLGPRLMQSRQGRDFDEMLRRAYQEAERVRNDSGTWNRLTEWVKANAPSTSSWR